MAVIKEKTSKGELRFKVRVRKADGTWHPQVTCYSKAEGLQVEADLKLKTLRDLELQSKVPLEYRNMTLLTYEDYWERWAKECRNHVSEGWKITQDQMNRDFIVPEIGKMPLVDIKQQDIKRLLDKAEDMGNGRRRAAESMSKIYNYLHKIFGDAINHFELLTVNPVQNKFRRKVIKKERAFLTPEQSWKLLNYTRDHWAGPAIWVQTLAALRIGETQPLLVSSLRFDEGHILIKSSYCRKTKKIKPNPKQGNWGKAPIAPELAEYLKEKVAGKGPTDFACPGPNGAMLEHSWFIKVLPRLCQEAGVPKITPHELRHSATELYVNAGASTEDIRRLLNHSSISTTMRYIHRTEERLLGIAAHLKPVRQ